MQDDSDFGFGFEFWFGASGSRGTKILALSESISVYTHICVYWPLQSGSKDKHKYQCEYFVFQLNQRPLLRHLAIYGTCRGWILDMGYGIGDMGYRQVPRHQQSSSVWAHTHHYVFFARIWNYFRRFKCKTHTKSSQSLCPDQADDRQEKKTLKIYEWKDFGGLFIMRPSCWDFHLPNKNNDHAMIS